MDGIVLIDKEKGKTSRDIVDEVSRKLHTKKVGHTGTLDPLATGLMVLCVNSGCKLVEMLTDHDKDYIAKVKLGIKTDTYDVTGIIQEEDKNYSLNKEELEKTLNSFKGEYFQEVPIYSSIKVNGKKLYEYAREEKQVTLPKHLVKIFDIKLLELTDNSFTFFVSVSKGTYIRSLINDIGSRLNIPMSMEELRRTRVGKYKIEDASSIDNLKIIPIIDAVDIKKVEINDVLYKKISNGVAIKNTFDAKEIMFIKGKQVVAIYKDDLGVLKSYRVFNNNL